MLFWLQTCLVNVPKNSGSYKIAEKMGMNPVLDSLTVYRVLKVKQVSLRGSAYFLAYDFTTASRRVYFAEQLAPEKREIVDDNPVVPVVAPDADVNSVPGVTCKTISSAARYYKGYRKVVDDDDDLPDDVPADVFHDIDNIFMQDTFQETGARFFFTAGDCQMIITALIRLSNRVPISGSELAELAQILVGEVEKCFEATRKAKKKIQ